MKHFLGKLIAWWAILYFFITMWIPALILVLTGFFPEPLKTKIFRAVVFVWMGSLFIVTGCRYRRRGIKHFEKGKTYIVTCNHNSFMDVPATTPFIPGANKTIAKIELSRIPLFGLFYKRGSVLVDRKSKNSRMESFRKMKDVLAKDMHMCIYPEGTRNKTTAPVGPFQDGAFRLASETGTPIIPAVIFNTKNSTPPNKGIFLRPGKIEIHFLPAIPVALGEDFVSLREKVHAQITDYYVSNKHLFD